MARRPAGGTLGADVVSAMAVGYRFGEAIEQADRVAMLALRTLQRNRERAVFGFCGCDVYYRSGRKTSSVLGHSCRRRRGRSGRGRLSKRS